MTLTTVSRDTSGCQRSHSDLFSPPAVILLSVPEDHHVRLPCGGSSSSDVVWTHQDRTVLVTRQGSYETNEDPRRYRLLPDGSLCLLQLDDSDDGEYRCNQQLVAELQVLTGRLRAVHCGTYVKRCL